VISLVQAGLRGYLSAVASRSDGSIPLFRFAGIQVYLHWSWFIIAYWQISKGGIGRYGPHYVKWAIAEYVALFAIVLMHEFGHALACRQVGGEAHHILLWPFGGVAFASPPPRPGALLWTIAAGPLVNVVLWPVLIVAGWYMGTTPLAGTDVHEWLHAVLTMNLWILIFNMLPLYPLDGGQILRALLWFGIGRARSLLVASVIGFIGLAACAWYAVQQQQWWSLVLVIFIFQQCLNGFRHAKELRALER
jgi:Zn-dependent protease